MNSWDDLFRSFFNIPGQRDKDTRWKEKNRDDTELLDPPEFGDNQEDTFEESFHFRFSEPDQMFRHLEEIFRDLGMAEFPPLGRGLGQPPHQPPHEREPITPRDRMLKPKSECPDRGCTQQPEQREPGFLPSIFGNLWRTPHWGGVRSQDKVDQEIEVENESVIVNEIVSGSRKGNDDVRVTCPSSSRDGPYFRFNSMSVTTVTRPDGSVEEVRTVHGKDGKQTTVTRYHGDKNDVVITRKDANGDTKTESFTNLDEGHLGEFNRKRSADDNTSSRETILAPQFEPRDEETKSLFKTLFGFTLP